MFFHLVPIHIHLAHREIAACGLEGGLQPEALADSTYPLEKRQWRLQQQQETR